LKGGAYGFAEIGLWGGVKMKLATWSHQHGPCHLGIVHEDNSRIFNLNVAADAAGEAPFGDMQALIDGGEAALSRLRDLFTRHSSNPAFNRRVQDVTLHAPPATPPAIAGQLTRFCVSPAIANATACPRLPPESTPPSAPWVSVALI
jgi:hypothetical protein